MSEVIIARGKDPRLRTYLALKALNPTFSRKVLIKPNLVEPMPNNSGAITRKEVVEGVIQFLKEMGYEMIVGEGAAIWNTMECFDMAGYFELSKKYKVKFLDLNRGKFERINGKFWEFEVAKIALECDVVSVAVLKEHAFGVTLTLKNLMGLLRPRGNYPLRAYMHAEGNEEIWAKRLMDLVRAIKPKLAIIDATTGMFGSHLFGKLVPLDLTLASKDAVACDLAGAELLGHKEISYLKLALEEGLGKNPRIRWIEIA
ncbi:MAG: DUF362 domain-containing protein [Candidatus Nanoarchaeia archaeon]|nr:DUF362 domain-containing protein [Candidatus Haiyanarchaeum thermophilum]MCW1302805.1 DUF362 domain-containing protein [Candidatus Haiyanarchaeum thermophilum]MCW1303486.1 DUF362 domain-containing protein [Candidatus Haiyanarchaeum thermophilum]MCW1306666.1 DUF362 domain-containing protein [Candidatus Haiyanarchaeum thermophilum]MCW1307378.1 DUF362 domain-containing protein [Candidatus Haiyanarchaeum thermophilum]